MVHTALYSVAHALRPAEPHLHNSPLRVRIMQLQDQTQRPAPLGTEASHLSAPGSTPLTRRHLAPHLVPKLHRPTIVLVRSTPCAVRPEQPGPPWYLCQ